MVNTNTKSCSAQSAEGVRCEMAHLARGLCTKHWREWRSTASEAELGYKYRTLQSAFDHWPTETNANGCMIWQGNHAGYEPRHYGVFTYRNKQIRAHRAAYELANGPIPEGYDVDHICHVTLCVNPEHLRAVTRKQNIENRTGKSNLNSLTGHRGITYDKGRKQYRARVKHHYGEIYVGRFDTLEEAVEAAAAKRRELFTHSDMDTRGKTLAGEVMPK